MTAEEYIKQKRNELEKMIPGFIRDEYSDIVLNFFERGIKEGIEFGISYIREQMMKNTVEIEDKCLKCKVT